MESKLKILCLKFCLISLLFVAHPAPGQNQALLNFNDLEASDYIERHLPLYTGLMTGMNTLHLINDDSKASPDLKIFVVGSALNFSSTILSWGKGPEAYATRHNFIKASSSALSAATILAAIYYLKEQELLDKIKTDLQQSVDSENKCQILIMDDKRLSQREFHSKEANEKYLNQIEFLQTCPLQLKELKMLATLRRYSQSGFKFKGVDFWKGQARVWKRKGKGWFGYQKAPIFNPVMSLSASTASFLEQEMAKSLLYPFSRIIFFAGQSIQTSFSKSFLKQPKDEILENDELFYPRKFPCLLKRGKACSAFKNNLSTPEFIEIPQELNLAISIIEEIGDGLQNRVAIDPKVFKNIQRLGKLSMQLLKLQREMMSKVDTYNRKQGDLNFDTLQLARIHFNSLNDKVRTMIKNSKLKTAKVFEIMEVNDKNYKPLSIDEQYTFLGSRETVYEYDTRKSDDREIIRRMNEKVKIIDSSKTSQSPSFSSKDSKKQESKSDEEIIDDNEKNIFKAISIRFIKSGFKLLGIEED